MNETSRTSDAASAVEDFPYEGTPGVTRLDTIHVPIPGGLIRSLQVYRNVNVESDPQLREPALAGALHRFDNGETLAIPFVFHDPANFKFIVCVPEVLRHQALSERARVLTAISEDTSVPVPPYVAECPVAVGLQELTERIAERSGAAARLKVLEARQAEVATLHEQLTVDQHAIAQKEQNLVTRERRLRGRAEEVTTREDELRILGEELEMRQRELAVREEELSARLEQLTARAVELSSRVRSEHPPDANTGGPSMTEGGKAIFSPPSESKPSDPTGSGETRVVPFAGLHMKPTPSSGSQKIDEVDLADVEVVTEGTSSLSGSSPISAEIVDIDIDADIKEIDDVSGLIPAPDAASLLTDNSVVTANARVQGAAVEDVDDDVVEVVDAEDVEDVEDVDVATVDSASTSLPEMPPAPTVQPSAALREKLGPPMEIKVDDDGLRIFVRREEGYEEAFASDEIDLLTQWMVVEGCQVVLLAVVDLSGRRPYVRRVALDPTSTADRVILNHLGERFEARLSVFDQDGEFVRSATLRAAREGNVALIKARAEGPDAREVDAATAAERALAAPPPVKINGIPFTTEPEPSKDAAAALSRLGKLQKWCAPDQLELALMALSVPKGQVDGTLDAAIKEALEYGLHLPGDLVERAVKAAEVDDASGLALKLLSTFKRTVNRLDRGGLKVEAVADNWEHLLGFAEAEDASVDEQVYDRAWKDIQKARGEDAVPNVDVEEKDLPKVETAGLIALLAHPRHRKPASLELLKRGEASSIEHVTKAMAKLPDEDMIEVAVQIVAQGDPAGGPLIDGLAARKEDVRKISAIGLSVLKLRRAIAPLVHLLESEESDLWKEVARALSAFGTPAFRPITRAMKDPKGDKERLSYALACLAENGFSREVEKLQKHSKEGVAKIALDSIPLREAASKHLAAIAADDAPSDESLKLGHAFRLAHDSRKK